MSYSIGVDLGGTNIKIVVISNDGNELEYLTCDTADAAGSWAQTIKQNVDEIQNQRGQSPCHIGLAAPGLAASDGRSIAYMQGRLKGLQGFVWQDFLDSVAPVVVLNDAHAALLGEAWRGAAKGYRNVILLTLGTGVGGAVLVEGRLIKGQIGRAGHLGHVTVYSDGGPDIVNTPGSLEQMIGNYNLAERSGGRFSSTRLLVEAHLRGDKEATTVWLRSIFHLAAAIASFINAFDPEIVIVGGGIAKAGPALFDPLRKELDRFEWRPLGHTVQVVPAALGEKAGAIGAAYYGIQEAKG
ncbi:MAG TPA: ROK family protein [Pyrinomonadaceae bacterium]|jgi:glucokinase|nr:ROK family protein [Pyrinomonadaceae bacterium]